MKPAAILIATLIIAQSLVSGARAQSPTPPPAPPGSGGTVFGAVRVLGGNNLPRNPGQENQPPVWLTLDTKGTSAVVTIGNATKVPLNFTGTVVIDLAPGARSVQVLVPTGTATIQGNQIVWTGFSLDSTQIVPAIVSLAPGGASSASGGSATAISEISIESKDQQSGTAVTERIAGGGPTLLALTSAPTVSTNAVPASAATATTGATPLPTNATRMLGVWAIALLAAVLAGTALLAWLVYTTGARIQHEVRAVLPPNSSNGATVAAAALDSSGVRATSLGSVPVAAPPEQPHDAVELVAIDGLDSGHRWTIERAETTIGRNSANDIVLAERTVSDRHARLTRHPDGSYAISDNGSTNGTQVNGRLVSVDTPLHDGDEVRVGNAILAFRASVTAPA
jgi:hypothetical protein